MKAICKSCGMAFPIDPDYIGYRVQCPHCGYQSVLEKADIIRTATPSRPVVNKKADGFDGLGFALGLLLNIPGVFIAALVNGRRGAISALWGLLIDGVVAFIGFVLMAAGI